MLPWPIALLSLFYTIIATISAAMAWQVISGTSHRPIIWPLIWLAVSGAVMCGLPLLKPWARTVTIAASWLVTVTTLAISGLLIAGGKPLPALMTTVSVVVHLIAIRYLRRPVVKALFDASDGVA